jgi:hypothetical protein
MHGHLIVLGREREQLLAEFAARFASRHVTKFFRLLTAMRCPLAIRPGLDQLFHW